MKLIWIFIALATMLGVTSCKKRRYENAQLQKIKSFDGNSGNLLMYYHEPDQPKDNMPLVVVLHGCNQNALGAAKLSDWNKLADRYGFYVLYPEQKKINNASDCFNWFKSKDNETGKGEVASIANMINKMHSDFHTDRSMTFITGMSAGGGMTMAMAACYPEYFEGAAVLAGGPYGVSGLDDGAKAMLGKLDKSPSEWGNIVRNARDNSLTVDDYPNLVIIHGKKDNVVDFKNANEILEQWSNVLDISLSSERDTSITTDVKLRYFSNSNETRQIWLYEIEKMGHELPTNPGTGPTEGGGSGVFAKDKDFFSTYWIANHFGLTP